MSAFTEWNGPAAGRGPSTKDVLALIDAYNNVNSVLAKHLESTATDDVHKFNTALQDAISTLETAVNAALSQKADKDSLTGVSNSVTENAQNIATEVSRAQAAENTIQISVANEASRAATQEGLLTASLNELEAAFEEFKELIGQRTGQISYDDEETTTIAGVVAATEYFLGVLKARYLIDFVEWTVISAQYAGTGTNDDATKTNGIYILGQLSEEWLPDKGFDSTHVQKSARAYIKYINDRPFDLIVDMTASGAANGTLTCLAAFEKEWTAGDPDNAWEDMCLHLLSNTDSSGAVHVYLGISARGLQGQSTEFHIAGVNFIAGGTVNGITGELTFTRVQEGYNAYRANIDVLRTQQIQDAQGTPYITIHFEKDALGIVTKDVYIGGEGWDEILFLKRPTVLIPPETEEDGDGYVAPVLTSYDIESLSNAAGWLGIIVQWPQWEEEEIDDPDHEGQTTTIRRAINYPDGWLACDGSTVSLDDYPKLREVLGLDDSATEAVLPLVDFGIIRYKDLFEDWEISTDVEGLYRILTHKELTEAIKLVQGNLEEEAQIREDADEQLQSNIDAEEAARIEADENLQTNINAETNARIEADNNLQTNINAETNARIEMDNNLQTNINAETNARIEADDNLQTNINAETNARIEADDNLQTNINAETNARAAADEALQSSLDTEVAGRKAADEALEASLDAETTARRDADTQLQSAVDTEINARREADTTLQSAIDAETVARKEADENLQEQIDNAHWTGTNAQLDAAKDSLADGTIILTTDDEDDGQ